MKAPRATELECEAAILAEAKRFGWRVHGERAAQTGKSWMTPIKGDPGWPDLVLVRGTELLVVELKRKPNKVEPEQKLWHEALSAAGVTVLVVWVPEEMQRFIERLAMRPRRNTT